MITRLFRLGLMAALPLVLAPLTNLPAAHAQEPSSGTWVRQLAEIGLRQKAGAPQGTIEDDKDYHFNDGEIFTNVPHFEVKCIASRQDGEKTKSPDASIRFLQPYKWFPNDGSSAPPYTEFFYIQTKGGETNASPIVDASVTDPFQKIGPAAATSSGTDTATNQSVNNSHHNDENAEDKIITYTSLTRTLVQVESKATASAGSISYSPLVPGGDAEGGYPPHSEPVYPNKACYAEGRAFWKFTDGTPYAPPTPPSNP